ncbi:MFS transporter [Streptomyces sp. HNM0574]|uniref:MFS transporter n=1 Tax=Streptomyces sp. HNM0574 TaxID=2714954 RepID=UPI00146B49A7|nr:MFS transporter [Streptomyces sp. HNM0574]NLU69837.1 MFS transporter [Streptomyces sp. HNM0574]
MSGRQPAADDGGQARLRRAARAVLPAPGQHRLLAVSWLVKTVGSGLYLPTSTLYFTRVAGLPVPQVATGLTVAGIVALAGAVPLGGLADRFGPRRVYAALLAVQFTVMAALVLVRGFPLFLGLITLFLLAEQGSTAARGALVATVGEGAERIRLRAYLRVVTNVGITVGAGLAALAIQADSRTAYTTLLLCTALTYLGAAVPLRGLPRDAVAGARAERGASAWSVLRDGRYVAVTAVCGVLSLQAPVLSFAVPVWVVDHTSAPPVLVSAVVVVNTVLVVLFQIRASRGAEDDTRAARLCRRAGLALLLACGVMAFTAAPPAWPAAGLLLLFAALLTLGELWLSAGSFGLSFSLAPDGAHGQYQGFFSLGRGAATAVAPWLLAVLCLGDDTGRGWILLGTVFAVAGLLAPLTVRRPAPPDTRRPAEAS